MDSKSNNLYKPSFDCSKIFPITCLPNHHTLFFYVHPLTILITCLLGYPNLLLYYLSNVRYYRELLLLSTKTPKKSLIIKLTSNLIIPSHHHHHVHNYTPIAPFTQYNLGFTVPYSPSSSTPSK